jgi:surface antigen
MKTSLINIALLMSISIFVLTACSTNTQKENTTIGAVSGAVVGGLAASAIGGGAGKVVAIGVGAIAGALLGGYIGHSMDSSDTSHMTTAMDNPTNQATTWRNKKTGSEYTVRPTSDVMSYKGNNYCRRFYTSAIIEGKTQRVHGVACKQANGTWTTVKS